MEKSALEFVEEYLKKEASEYYESDGFEYCFGEWIADDSIYSKSIGSSRWWDNLFCVAKVDGVLIGYNWASTTGDKNVDEVGWEFDKSTICYVEEKEVKTVKYVVKK